MPDSDTTTDTPTPDTTTQPPAADPPAPKRRRRSAQRPAGPPSATFTEPATTTDLPSGGDADSPSGGAAAVPVFQPPEETPPKRRRASGSSSTSTTSRTKPSKAASATKDQPSADAPDRDATADAAAPGDSAPAPSGADSKQSAATGGETTDSEANGASDADGSDEDGGQRRRRRRGGRGRRKPGAGADGDDTATDDQSSSPGGADAASTTKGRGTKGGGTKGDTAKDASSKEGSTEDGESKDKDAGDDAATDAEGSSGSGSSSSRRRRRRRRKTDTSEGEPRNDDPEETVVRVRESRSSEKHITATKGSTRVEAKKQRRRDGRDSGRRRPTIMSESEFLARRESVERVMVVRQRGDSEQPLTQIAVLEDGMLVEHYVDQGTQRSIIGNIYLGKVQNVLPAMEAAFIDIGRGRNAVLYAGEVDWSRAEGKPKRIEEALKSGDSVLVQVTKDPIGHKGARLTSSISLPGRFVVYVPGGSMSGISRKLSDTERSRLRQILKDVVPDEAEVIIRTAAEGAGEEELRRDVARLKAQWEDIEGKSANASAPATLYAEPDLTLKIVRDLFNEDFNALVVSGDDAWDTIEPYVSHVAPTISDRLTRWQSDEDAFDHYRVDEQIAKALERKVWLPSGGSLVIDRTEAMTVIDVNTGKFTGGGGNLEETVTKNNLEAAEEVARQLRLRDIGGIIVVDFIDMVLGSNRDLVMRRLVECLARDRTRHQVAEVTSLGLVQMTRKRIGTGLLETFSKPCDCCGGRGLTTTSEPVPVPATQRATGRKQKPRKRSSSSASSDSNAV